VYGIKRCFTYSFNGYLHVDLRSSDADNKWVHKSWSKYVTYHAFSKSACCVDFLVFVQ